MLGLVRLADFLGMDDFLELAARWLDVSVNAISNHNSVRSVYQVIRGRYRASRDKQRIHIGLCVRCCRSICPSVQSPCRPQLEDLPRSPCCNLPVHPKCKSPPQCRNCYQLLRVLPCVICRRPIARGEDFAREYEAALPHRTPCCSADCHPQCNSSGDTSCSLCSTPLKGWKVDKELEMAVYKMSYTFVSSWIVEDCVTLHSLASRAP